MRVIVAFPSVSRNADRFAYKLTLAVGQKSVRGDPCRKLEELFRRTMSDNQRGAGR